MVKYCYINGEVIAVDKATVSVNDLGLLRGYAVFDFIRIQNKKPIFWDAHMNRFENSAKSLDLKIPLSREEIKHIIEELLEKNSLVDATARLVLTGGDSEDSLTCDDESPTFFVLTKELPKYPVEIYEKGIKLMTFEHQREKSEAKSNNYITLLSLKNQKKEQKAFEVLYTSNGLVLEGATCNFFLFKGDTLVTAKDNILLGTRRAAILKLAKGKFKVEERDIKLQEINKATETFISSVTRDIVPVVKIDESQIGNGKVGANTQFLMKKLNELVEKESGNKAYC